jgi:Uma2 family endonuclease
MPTIAAPFPLLGTQAGFRRFSVPEYHKLIEIGMLSEDDNLELLEGYLVLKMARNPPHDSAIQLGQERLSNVLPVGWRIPVQSAITLPDSEPEPDIAVVRGNARTYVAHHPTPADIGLVVEASDSTLAGDRTDKGRIFARAGIVCYWIVNLLDRQVEVYTQPSGPSAAPAYGQQVTYRAGDSVPFQLDGVLVAAIPVNDLLP